MSLIEDMRTQDAVHWAAGPPDKTGKPTVGHPTAVVVRWEDKHEKFMNPEGEEVVSNAVVYVPEVSNGVEMHEGDYLWLGVIGNEPENPVIDKDAHQIRKFEKLPDIEGEEFLRTAIL